MARIHKSTQTQTHTRAPTTIVSSRYFEINWMSWSMTFSLNAIRLAKDIDDRKKTIITLFIIFYWIFVTQSFGGKNKSFCLFVRRHFWKEWFCWLSMENCLIDIVSCLFQPIRTENENANEFEQKSTPNQYDWVFFLIWILTFFWHCLLADIT